RSARPRRGAAPRRALLARRRRRAVRRGAALSRGARDHRPRLRRAFAGEPARRRSHSDPAARAAVRDGIQGDRLRHRPVDARDEDGEARARGHQERNVRDAGQGRDLPGISLRGRLRRLGGRRDAVRTARGLVTVLERLGAHAAGGYGRGPPGAALTGLRLHVADTVGAWVAACTTAEGRALLAFEPAERASLPGRVALACALARLSETDDIHLASCTTPGALVVPAAITVGASLGRGAAEIAAAIAAGYDIMTRLGEALDGPTILYRGVWPTFFLAPVAVAGACARLLRLDEKQAAHALAIAQALA